MGDDDDRFVDILQVFLVMADQVLDDSMDHQIQVILFAF